MLQLPRARSGAFSGKKDILEKYIRFSYGLFLRCSCWYNLHWNYLLEAQ
jgi:hypothetical protein